MEYQMKLTFEPFEKTRKGIKKIEMRLYDEKRKKIKVGDTIVFINKQNTNMKLVTQVEKIYIFKNFFDLYQSLPIEDLGYIGSEVLKASPKDMEKYYSLEEQLKYSVVGYRLKLMKQLRF